VTQTSKISSAAHDIAVSIETRDEHHMGAATVLVHFSRPLRGVSEFQTTNGRAFFTPSGNGLIVHDATTVLFFDLESEQVFSVQPPSGWYLTNVRVESDEIKGDLYDGHGRTRSITPIPLARVPMEFAPGFGPVERGRFPSAYP
jgi:hypothetical protein